MTRIRNIIAYALLSLAPVTLAPVSSMAQVSTMDVTRAESAILSAGTRAAIVAHIKSVPSVGVINLAFRTTPSFNSDLPDPAEFRISAGKNINGINRLRAALTANPATRKALASHGIAVNRVVGVDVSSGGSLRLYIL